MSTEPIRAIANPASWADAPELPRVDWGAAEYLAEPEPLRYAAPPTLRPEDRTHCPKGHPYDEENTYTPPGTNLRVCRTCRRGHYRRYYNRVYRALPAPRKAPPRDPKPTPARPAPTPTPPSPPTTHARREASCPPAARPLPKASPCVQPVKVDSAPAREADGNPDLGRARARIAARRQRREGVAVQDACSDDSAQS